MDSNGYNPSIMDTEPGVCFICTATGDTARHEVFYGISNRRNSKINGLWVYLCPRCHRWVHAENPLKLKIGAQERYEENHTRAEFMELIGRNYLEI